MIDNDDDLRIFIARNEKIKQLQKQKSQQSNILKDSNASRKTLNCSSKPKITMKTLNKNKGMRKSQQEQVIERLYMKEKERLSNLEEIKKKYESQKNKEIQPKPNISRKSQEIMKNAKKKKKTKAATPDITFSSYKKVESNYATKQRVESFTQCQNQWLQKRNDNLEKQKLLQQLKDDDSYIYTPLMSKRSYSMRTGRSMHSRQQ